MRMKHFLAGLGIAFGLWIVASVGCLALSRKMEAVYARRAWRPSARAVAELIPAGRAVSLSQAFVAVDERTLRDLNRACRDRDELTVERLVNAGRVYVAGEGTPATVVEPGILTYRVRLAGGKEGLVASEFVRAK